MTAYPRGRGDGLDALTSRFQSDEDRIRQLEIPSGTRFGSVKNWVRTKLAELQETVTDLVTDAMAGYYTKAETDSKVANPGNIAPGNVTASGAVTAAGAVSGDSGTFSASLSSVGAYNTLVTGGGTYRATWQHETGFFGYAPSSRRFKTDIQSFTPDVEALEALRVVVFRYLASPPYDQAQQPLTVGLIAEEVHELGLHWLVDYDDNGEPFGVKYELLGLAALMLVQSR